jgi:excisionase family DNA binding protein
MTAIVIYHNLSGSLNTEEKRKLLMPIVDPAKIKRDVLYTVEEAAEMLDVDEQTIRRYIQTKKLSARKNPSSRRWLIKGGDLVAFIGK